MIDGGLRTLFREQLRAGIHWQSIESGSTGGGVPDSNYASLGIERWLEFKQTSGWACTLKPDQVGWHVNRFLHGARTLIATRRWGTTLGTDELWIHDGRWARELKVGGLRAVKPIDSWHSPWNWGEIRNVLIMDNYELDRRAEEC